MLEAKQLFVWRVPLEFGHDFNLAVRTRRIQTSTRNEIAYPCVISIWIKNVVEIEVMHLDVFRQVDLLPMREEKDVSSILRFSVYSLTHPIQIQQLYRRFLTYFNSCTTKLLWLFIIIVSFSCFRSSLFVRGRFLTTTLILGGSFCSIRMSIQQLIGKRQVRDNFVWIDLHWLSFQTTVCSLSFV